MKSCITTDINTNYVQQFEVFKKLLFMQEKNNQLRDTENIISTEQIKRI